MNESERRRIHNNQVMSALVMGLFFYGIPFIYLASIAMIGLTVIVMMSGFFLGFVRREVFFFYAGIGMTIELILLVMGYIFLKLIRK